MKISSVLAVVFGLALVVLGFFLLEAITGRQMADRETESCKVQSKKALEEQEKRLKGHYGEQIASRDQALDNLERQIWAERDKAVEAIVKASEFRKANPDVPQPEERSVTINGTDGKPQLVSLFPAEKKALESIDAEYGQGIKYLTMLNRVTCKDERQYHGTSIKKCYGSQAVGARVVQSTFR